jgi:hypothetical protein
VLSYFTKERKIQFFQDKKPLKKQNVISDWGWGGGGSVSESQNDSWGGLK